MHLHTPTEALYDLTFLEEMDDNDYLLEILTLLVTETSIELKTMREAALKGDHDTVAKRAHVLKSTAGIICVKKLVDIMVAIEMSIKDEAVTKELLSLIDHASNIYTIVEKSLQQKITLLQEPHRTN